jgi:hypothetical protein
MYQVQAGSHPIVPFGLYEGRSLATLAVSGNSGSLRQLWHWQSLATPALHGNSGRPFTWQLKFLNGTPAVNSWQFQQSLAPRAISDNFGFPWQL